MKYNLEERTAKFGESVIGFCKQFNRSPIIDPLVTQLVKCATSVGANYCEADDAESGQDFKHKIGISKKEAREAKHFIRMLIVMRPDLKEQALILWQEAKEINLIFNSIYNKVKKSQNKLT